MHLCDEIRGASEYLQLTHGWAPGNRCLCTRWCCLGWALTEGVFQGALSLLLAAGWAGEVCLLTVLSCAGWSLNCS